MKGKKALYTATTTLITAGNINKSCLVSVMNDSLLVEIAWQPNILVHFDHLTQVLFEDKSHPELSMAGFCVDYKDGKGSCRLLFFTSGWFSVSRTKKLVKAIKDAYSTYYQGTSVEDLTVVDVSEVKRLKANDPVHRNI